MPALFFLLLLLSSYTTTAISARHDAQSSSSSSHVAASCARARYPSLCVRTLAPSSPRSPTDLAIASVAATLSSASSALSSLRRLTYPSTAGPLRDCLQQLSDSADQLSRTKAELSSLRSETTRMQLDNACTWVSAALTNEDTCLDGMKEAGGVARSVKVDVSGKVREVERLTSNALYFITRLASSSSRG